MARLDDDSGLESECADENDGGVTLAGHEDTMDVDGTAADRDYPGAAPGQGFSAPSGITQFTATPADANSLSIAQGIEPDFEGSGETSDGDVFSQPVTSNTLGGLNQQTSESSTQTPITQDPSASHNMSSSYPGFPSGSSLSPLQAADWLFGPEAHLDIYTPFPDQDSSANLDQPVPSTISSFSDEVFQGANALMTQHLEQPYPQIYAWHTDALDVPHHYYDEQKNMSLVDCLEYCTRGRAAQDANPQTVGLVGSFPRITDQDIEWGRRKRKEESVANGDVASGRYDFQGIDWKAFGTTRATIRRMRRRTYLNHTNLLRSCSENRIFNGWPMFASAQDMELDARDNPNPITAREKYFHFSRMNLEHQICIPHFQLRHTISASSKNAVFFPTVTKDEGGVETMGSQITNFNPEVEKDSYVVDSARVDPDLNTPEMNKIYALSAKNEVLVAGGLAGEYAYKSLSSGPSAPFTSGMITHSELSSTNHVHTYLSRQSGLPQAVFSSNDSHIHTLDLTTNKFISRHDHVKYVNCSATSPDTRLRVLVRDAVHPLIVEADTGKRIGKLKGHKDFGFACDWSADGRYIATGAQDGLVQIFDMRKCGWRAGPVQTLLAEIGGVRSLVFSPAGSSGKPVLLMAESADFVHIVDASDGMFAKKQTVDFFGEIAGVTFEDSGSRFWVGVADPDFGGLMEFEREKGSKFGPVGGGRGKRNERTEDSVRTGALADSGEQKRRRRKMVIS
ncbi:MAG: hypothetical protein Q9199_002692 [Rusavskia elegans]